MSVSGTGNAPGEIGFGLVQYSVSLVEALVVWGVYIWACRRMGAQ